MNTYPSEPLNREKRSIRLLTVHPGQPEETLRCTLKHYELERKLKYDALSYTWDHVSGERTQIECNEMPFWIGENLHEFLCLYRSRLVDGNNKLWIDAICINQGDVLERNHQVAEMRKIYTSAASTIAWLGKSTDDDAEAFETLRAMEERQRLNFFPFDSWYELFSKRYWKRMWIIQECVVAKQLTLWCGSFQGTADKFYHLGNEYSGCAHALSSAYGWRIMILRDKWAMRNRNPYSTVNANDFCFQTLSRSFAHSRASDAHDYVYALIGISNDVSITPNYGRSLVHVALDVIETFSDPGEELFFQKSIPRFGQEVSFDYLYNENNEKLDTRRDFISHLCSKLEIRGEEMAALFEYVCSTKDPISQRSIRQSIYNTPKYDEEKAFTYQGQLYYILW